jgi:Short C-terminal domain
VRSQLLTKRQATNRARRQPVLVVGQAYTWECSFSTNARATPARAGCLPPHRRSARHVREVSVSTTGFLAGAQASREAVCATAPARGGAAAAGPRRGPRPDGPVADEIAKLADLRGRGLVTDEEFAAAKARLLGH